MSWFRGKPKNRRLGRMHVLDVKLRSDQVRASRMRLTAVALGITFGTILGFFLVWRAGEFALDRLIYENKAFVVQEIDVRTDGVIAEAQLRRWAGVKPGENLLALDLARVKRDLEMVSTIRSVAVERILPHTLRLRVTERDPLAQIPVMLKQVNGAVQQTVLQIDADGWVMTPIDPRQRATPVTQTNDALPSIYGLNPMEVVPGRRIDSTQARAALQLLSAFDRSPLSGFVEIKSVDVTSPQILVALTGQGSQITFDVQNLERQLTLWRTVYEEAAHAGKSIATLDLSVHGNSPATFMAASAVPQTIPKIKNLQRKGKRNV